MQLLSWSGRSCPLWNTRVGESPPLDPVACQLNPASPTPSHRVPLLTLWQHNPKVQHSHQNRSTRLDAIPSQFHPPVAQLVYERYHFSVLLSRQRGLYSSSFHTKILFTFFIPPILTPGPNYCSYCMSLHYRSTCRTVITITCVVLLQKLA